MRIVAPINSEDNIVNRNYRAGFKFGTSERVVREKMGGKRKDTVRPEPY